MSQLLFIAGLALLVMGKVSVGNIEAEGPKVRAAGFMLAMPMLVVIVISTMFNFIFGNNGDGTSPNGTLFLLLIEVTSWVVCIGVAYTLIREEAGGSLFTPPTINLPPKDDEQTNSQQQQTPVAQPEPKPTPSQQRGNFPSVMSLRQAASYLNITEQDVLKLIEDGKLTAARINYRYQISRSVLDDFIQNQGD